MFLGTYNQKLDGKGRMVVPSKYRDEIGSAGLVVVPWWEKNLTVFTEDGFRGYMDSLSELKGSPREKREIKRFITANADMLKIDGQGRILLSQKLRSYANLTGNVVITGNMESFEIWNPESWELVSRKLDDAEAMSEELERLQQIL